MKIFVDNKYFEIVAQHFFGRTLVEFGQLEQQQQQQKRGQLNLRRSRVSAGTLAAEM